MSELENIHSLLQGPGEVIPGIEMSWEQARDRVLLSDHSCWVPYCIVRDWIWIDLILTDQEREQLQAAGQQPVVMYSHSVLFDSNRRFDVGDWVRTSPLVTFTEGCFFRTRNSLYVLVGDGVRKRADLSTVMGLQ
ncbi:DUF6957 family protein [Pseudomonas borbori]|uniref:DUF6957 domain-containing protein n=1 Tax=Pseudomonas borbori TaxID=289003 RepID=A0A1I5LCT4_9PSED|nr:hypothetical protein [Pseudomonas borbori]SFO95100.1 hypothetical protein SAMN05216190_1037 [Pseudomonas borbori]